MSISEQNTKANAAVKKKVFVLGDSRTGTTTLHKFLESACYKSVHYFFDQSGVHDPAHIDFDKNWEKLRNFINDSGFDAFSDYPLRAFYKQVCSSYPEADYILCYRKDIETWRKSMLRFFSKHDIEIDIETLERSHVAINEDIRRLAREQKLSFCEVCIDDDADENGRRLSDFLHLRFPMRLGWENRTDAYDNRLLSSQVTFFDTDADNVLDYVKRAIYPAKSMLSEHGWVYLINDTSNFMDYAFGAQGWNQEQLESAKLTLERRAKWLSESGVEYLKIVVPEKAAVYPEYLPKVFANRRINDDRPAKLLEGLRLPFLCYFDAMLRDVRAFGQVYFRGDSHANWYGAFFLYQSIVGALNDRLSTRPGMKTVPPFPISQFRPFVVSYGGDLYAQLDKETVSVFYGAWKAINLGSELEHLVGYELQAVHRKAHRVEIERDYLEHLGDRETFRFSHPNRALPRAVIFRDSTADYLVELLAQHFSESLFIWDKGLVYRDVIERERPDIVVHIMAERFLPQYTHMEPFVDLFEEPS